MTSDGLYQTHEPEIMSHFRCLSWMDYLRLVVLIKEKGPATGAVKQNQSQVRDGEQEGETARGNQNKI